MAELGVRLLSYLCPVVSFPHWIKAHPSCQGGRRQLLRGRWLKASHDIIKVSANNSMNIMYKKLRVIIILYFTTLFTGEQGLDISLTNLENKEIKVHGKPNNRKITIHVTHIFCLDTSVSCQGIKYDLNRVGKMAKLP